MMTRVIENLDRPARLRASKRGANQRREVSSGKEREIAVSTVLCIGTEKSFCQLHFDNVHFDRAKSSLYRHFGRFGE